MIPTMFIGITIAISGFSYRIGRTCTLNHENGTLAFWGWILCFACTGLAIILFTAVHCFIIYVRSGRSGLHNDNVESTGVGRAKRASLLHRFHYAIRGGLYFDRNAVSGTEAKEQWVTIQQVLVLEWRNVALSVILAIQLIFFSTIYWKEDAKIAYAPGHSRMEAFAECLVEKGGYRRPCVKQVEGILLPRSTVLTGMVIAAVRIPSRPRAEARNDH